MKLNDTKLRNLKPKAKSYREYDGGNLYLHVMPNGRMYWKMDYRFHSKRNTASFGTYPRVTLKEAREKRENAKRLLDEGKDPNEVKKLAKLEQATDYENSFEVLAKEWHQQHLHTWKPKHGRNVLKRLETNIFPTIGSRPIKSVTPAEILAAVRKVEEQGKNDLAHRIVQTCRQIFRYAMATGRADTDPTDALKGALQPVKTKHHAHLKEEELPGFLKELDQYDTKYNGNILTKLAFKMLVLTFLRSIEIRGAKWDEIDWKKKQWKVPAERMKMNEAHIVPLAEQSIEILKQLKEITSHNHSNFIFPSQHNPKTHMSENTFLRALKIMGYRGEKGKPGEKGETTAHGFRSVASTILHEAQFKSAIIERQLSHAERDQVKAAYNYAEYLDERAKMMQWWADYLDGIKN